MVATRPTLRTADRNVCDRLRTARRRRRLTLDEVATVLRIPPAHLKALEEGELRVFSAEVYARGAYQKYAHYLGVEGDDSYRAFLRSLSDAREHVPLTLPLPATWLQRLLTPSRVILAVVAAGVLAVMGYVGWQVQSFVRLPDVTLFEPQVFELQARSVPVRGWVEEGATVRINGEAVLPGGEGIFEFELPLRPGINVLQVEAVGASGRTRVIRRELLVPRS